ncbi:putative FAD-linked sulfhydryl oxidase [Clavispora lusitaniae]|uniref:Sulfhydryl oxidase n=3 Tax=Clavispora lusitaniae TaxID=36911 RepID=C4Y469_CLAL4|nr:uncharacterized protein CLUG_02441 [Clavispora lusitaniae ATCC 42720]KAF7580285.1 Erv1 / Alr family protein [Clavispora lusitaniae]EEQ38315.1 hypothetical protein CLUG_02441 [Clavispora lusitaniae ATCC 42720]OVF05166.1 putative sulfhydryl oxidase [Clavispora lusitaniae]QFZ27850.1 putative FAD-linked sulfhydryl oxidase [Clavispora lusitaniae]QFZ32843.1 putative FAD-linked sulfhydryl oxidase [Clavispora lusitaniae]
MRHGKTPYFPILLLLFVVSAIYYVASGDKKSLGAAGPVTLVTEKAKEIPRKIEKEEVVIPDEKQVETGEFTETPFMPKMANDTLKAQLGNSAWHLLHTVLARYPDEPTEKEKSTLKQFILLFSQVYPCGDCARHFQKLLKKYPPQVGSRKIAAVWGCHIHNKVNERLNKPEYDCTTILEDYDCGCGEDEKKSDFTLGNESMEHLRKVKVDEKEDKQRGG